MSLQMVHAGIQRQTIIALVLVDAARVFCTDASFIAWADSFVAGKRTMRQACLIFGGSKAEDAFWDKHPEASRAYSAAKELSKLLEKDLRPKDEMGRFS